MKNIKVLLESSKDIWDGFFTHPFVSEMRDGTLSREVFRYYILQDTLYLKDYARVFALGCAKADTLELSSLFAEYIPTMHGEMNVHSGYLARLGITSEELAASSPSLINRAYTSYMLRTAYEGAAAEILAAVIPCAYSYELIARRMTDSAPLCVSDSLYGDWIRSYSSEEYSASNRELLAAFESVTHAADSATLSRLSDIFLTCSRFESEFWSMAYNMHQ